MPDTIYSGCIITDISCICRELIMKDGRVQEALRLRAENTDMFFLLKHNGAEEYGGPLFWAHYSYLGLNPHNLKDKYADYWQENKNQTLINWKWCSLNPMKYAGYGENCWGLTASYSMNGYAAHAPGEENDLGVISPTAALSSFPYTPEQSMNAIKHFYYDLGNKIWGEYGFYDAFSEQNNWYPQRYLAIDQGPTSRYDRELPDRFIMESFYVGRGSAKRFENYLGFLLNNKVLAILLFHEFKII